MKLVLASNNNVTNAFTTSIAGNAVNGDVSFGDSTFNYYFGNKSAKKL